MTNKLESAIVFCILDVQVPYNAVIKAYSALEKAGITNRDSIKKTPLFYIKDLLVSTGYRFPNQKASYIKKFGDNTTDLENATREELVKEIKGIGMKLASMYLNWTRDTNYAVLDTHIISFLKEHEAYSKSYLDAEANFTAIATSKGMTVSELDKVIWEERRVKTKR